MTLYNQASFKNSRLASRKPTTQALTYHVNVPLAVNTLLRPANPVRTYITIRNTSLLSTDIVYYDYFDNVNMLTEGFALKGGEAADLESPQALYAQATGNASIIDIDEGEG